MDPVSFLSASGYVLPGIEIMQTESEVLSIYFLLHNYYNKYMDCPARLRLPGRIWKKEERYYADKGRITAAQRD